MKKRVSKPKNRMPIEDSLAFIIEHMATKGELKSETVTLRGDIAELSRRVASLERGQKEILETLEPLSRAHDKDSVVIVDHDRRIVRLERRVGV